MPNTFKTFLKLHKVSLLLVVLSIMFYYTFAYHLVRTDFVKLLTLFIALFLLCFKLIQFEKWNVKYLLAVGIIFRLIFLFTEPTLSQDFYRFIWDGHLVAKSINPYLHTPNEIIANMATMIPNANELYNGMGTLSAKHYSNYPPLNQLIFGLAALIGGKSMFASLVVMRSTIILADIGIFYFGRKLLKNLNKSPQLIFWYFLNPLVIIELTGNLHFEGVMLFFFILSIFLLSLKKWTWAAIILACSISIKLVPILFLPLFLPYLRWKKSSVFYILIAATSFLLFLPFYTPEFIANYTKTLSLWFSNFEFNASIYNIVKQVAIQFEAKPWEFIKTYGKITPALTIITVLLFTFLPKRKDLNQLIASMMWVLTIYYFISTTIHPWYSIFLVLLAIFTSYKYAIIWSAAIVLSYFAYSQTDFKENLWLLSIEYISVYGFIIYEIVAHNNKK
ncbi:mannosyltransferase [Maribacter hydrothermalis]|uniref:Mannosyltransferase n=1 Tax=Maribacter hydrothermalis TaxID=1836467 RepID=A0A1B7Z3C2_9FLAO|nr:mannosyltransferase [Maribacter hydrothermalis]APQ16927.1 mannosyltransferase [Maribacter hydrothermalis]OBR37188.1 mannosyltransferase [Maribacter hydrothermalis]